MNRAIATRQPPSTNAFTLLELMVVIGIIAVMLAALIPAVTSLTKSTGAKSAVTAVMNTLEQARTLAVTNGSPTYVAFANAPTPENYRFKAYIVFQEKPDFTHAAVTKWYFLPTGISFQPASGLLKPQSGAVRIGFVCPGTVGTAPLELPFIKFDANGMVAEPTTAADLFVKIFAGFVDASGAPTFTDKTQATSLKLDQVAIARFTGRPHYVDPYATP